MSDIGLDRTEEEILNYDVSDDALEAAAGRGGAQGIADTHPFAIICIPFAPETADRSEAGRGLPSGQ